MGYTARKKLKNIENLEHFKKEIKTCKPDKVNVLLVSEKSAEISYISAIYLHERERKREREKERERESESESESERERQRQRQRERQRETERETERQREREGQRETGSSNKCLKLPKTVLDFPELFQCSGNCLRLPRTV